MKLLGSILAKMTKKRRDLQAGCEKFGALSIAILPHFV